MKKIESLKQLVETIEEETLASGNYCYHDDEEDYKPVTYCVVGHLLKIGNLPLEKLELLDNREDGNPYNSYMIGEILHDDVPQEEHFVKNTLVALGFDFDLSSDYDDSNHLRELQYINDNMSYNQADAKARLIEYINDWIKGIENENMA